MFGNVRLFKYRIKLSVFTLHLKIILKPLRKCSKYLISYTKPHNKESSSKTGRWLKTCLSLTNIDVNVCQAHSTRSLSTTKAVQLPPIGDGTSWMVAGKHVQEIL